MKYNVKETDGPAASASAAVIIARRNKEKVLVGGYVKRGDKKEEKTATAHRSTSSCVFFFILPSEYSRLHQLHSTWSFYICTLDRRVVSNVIDSCLFSYWS